MKSERGGGQRFRGTNKVPPASVGKHGHRVIPDGRGEKKGGV